MTHLYFDKEKRNKKERRRKKFTRVQLPHRHVHANRRQKKHGETLPTPSWNVVYGFGTMQHTPRNNNICIYHKTMSPPSTCLL